MSRTTPDVGRRIVRYAIGLVLAVIPALALLFVMTPWDRDHCASGTAQMCGEGVAATVEYAGVAGFSSCNVRCGSEAGIVTVIDRSWPLGEDR